MLLKSIIISSKTTQNLKYYELQYTELVKTEK